MHNLLCGGEKKISEEELAEIRKMFDNPEVAGDAANKNTRRS